MGAGYPPVADTPCARRYLPVADTRRPYFLCPPAWQKIRGTKVSPHVIPDAGGHVVTHDLE